MAAHESPRKVETARQQWALGSWEMHSSQAAARLAPFLVGGYLGFREETIRPLARREVATLRVPLILNLGAPYQVTVGSSARPEAFSSLVAGVSDMPAVVQGATHSCAMQVDLTPLGARALFRRPLDELTNQVIVLEDVLGAAAGELIERLQEAASWEARFALLDDFFLARLTSADTCDARVAHVWAQLHATGGQARVDELAREVGWSRKHLGSRFRDHVGLTPKVAARVMRFEALLARSRTRGRRTWSELAATCGYFDQAHLNRDFAEFAHTTPGAYLRDLVPGDAGLIADAESFALERR
jgi:AraC-like DNA-binding protein